MEPDEPRIQDVRAWLRKAQLDLRAAAHLLLAPEQELSGDAMFHAQQAAEKALKACSYAQGEELVVRHSVRQLCARAAEYEPRFHNRISEWGILDS